MQLARWHEHTGPTVLVIAFLAVLGLDMGINRARDYLVSALRLVLVDHRGALAVMAHTRHQVSKTRAATGRELVAGVPKVMVMPTSA